MYLTPEQKVRGRWSRFTFYGSKGRTEPILLLTTSYRHAQDMVYIYFALYKIPERFGGHIGDGSTRQDPRMVSRSATSFSAPSCWKDARCIEFTSLRYTLLYVMESPSCSSPRCW